MVQPEGNPQDLITINIGNGILGGVVIILYIIMCIIIIKKKEQQYNIIKVIYANVMTVSNNCI